MAEDAIDKVVEISNLKPRPSVTADLAIAGKDASASEELLHPDLPYTHEDVVRSVREEMARTVEDVLARRTRALFLNAQAAIEIAPRVAEIMAEELRKSESWIEQQIENFNKTAESYAKN
jgi:glycerol-3-phosphate dehydrogenase